MEVISAKALKAYKKQSGKKDVSSLTAVEYRELVRISSAIDKKKEAFFFKLDVERTDYGYFVVFTGKHLSKNRVNSLSFKDKIRYKNSVKSAMEVYRLQNLRKKAFNTLQEARITYTFFNPKSRDGDANSETIKLVQDVLTRLGLIKDDTRDVIIEPPREKEIIAREYKIEIAVEAA